MVYEAYFNNGKITINEEPASATVGLLIDQALDIIDGSILSENGAIYNDAENEKIYYFEAEEKNFQSAIETIRNGLSKEFDNFLVELSYILECANKGEPLLLGVEIAPTEVELNRGWLIENEETVGETNFVVPMSFVAENYKSCPTNGECESLEEFLDVYEPETDGQHLYELAKEKGAMIEDAREVRYEEEREY